MVLDLLQPLAQAYFAGKIPCTLSYGQAAIFLCLGLQQVDIDAIEKALNLPSNQILALFNKVKLLHMSCGAMTDALPFRDTHFVALCQCHIMFPKGSAVKNSGQAARLP